MALSRLAAARAEGLLTLPEAGPILVLRPPVGADLAALPKAQLAIESGWFPDAEYWQRAGYAVSAPQAADGAEARGEAALALVFLPRSKALARKLIAEAGRRAPLVVIDGQRHDGIDAIWRELRGLAGDLPVLAKAHGRLMLVPAGKIPAAWSVAEAGPGPDGWHRAAGGFAEDGIDRGSRLLAEALPDKLPARMADLGAGWGYLAARVLGHDSVKRLDLIEAEAASLAAARRNITDSRARLFWADATAFTPEARYDGIVTNPPFHTSRAAEPALGRAFITAARKLLTPQGQLWLVANRHLPYEAALAEAFVQVSEIGGDGAFKLIHATRPRR